MLRIKIIKALWFLKFKYKKFGRRSVIYKPILISGKKHISIGNNVFIRNGARIEAIASWNSSEYSPNISIGDGTTIEQGFHCTSAGNLIIGNNCDILPRVMITTISHCYENIEKSINQQEIEVRDVYIGDNCFIGMDAKIFPGVKIGRNAVIGANSIVMNDVPDYTVAVGVPAKVIKKYDFDNKKWINV